MNKLHATRRVAFHAVLMAALAVSGCGGAFSGDDNSTGPSEATSQTGSSGSSGQQNNSSGAPTVAATELVTNPGFESTTGWTLRDSAVVSSNLWADGKAVKVTSGLNQGLSNKLQPGKAYTLRVKARNETGAGSAGISVSFFNAAGNEKIRSFGKAFDGGGTGVQEYVLDFTAPAYAAKADIGISAVKTTLSIDSVSLKMRSPIDQTEPIASNANSYVPAGYKLAFNDEFNGTTLNRSKWFTRYIYAGGGMDRLNDEQQRYRDNDNHRVANGVLSLISRKVTTNDQWGINWESGMIRSDWTTRYGYFEARVKMPGGLGVWPAFWLNSDVTPSGKLGWPPEIDIFEFVNNGVEDRVNMIHSGVITRGKMAPAPFSFADAAYNKQWGAWYAPFNFNDDWHTIGGEWTESGFTMFVDGKKIYSRAYQWTLEDGSEAGPAHVLLNLAIGGGSWAGRHGVDVTQQEFKIDWVRVYKKN